MKPSSITTEPWVMVHSHDHDEYEDTGREGKWMIFRSIDEADKLWSSCIELATEDGHLGISAKVATSYPNPLAKDPKTRLICVYTYDHEDVEDVNRVREKLRELGIEETLYYKTEQATAQRRYGKNSWKYKG